MWWLSAINGQHNNFNGQVLAYEALHGAGGAVVVLDPSEGGIGDKEYDEDDVENYLGDRNVLDAASEDSIVIEEQSLAEFDSLVLKTLAKEESGPELWQGTEGENLVNTDAAPKPVGPYPHARRIGDLLYLSGVGPRQAQTNSIPGGPIKDENGAPLDYDIEAQTRACIENIKVILEASGSGIDKVLDVTSFLVDMDRDFKGYNKVYSEYFQDVGATRTTLAVRALPTPIAVELKVIASL
ncbi:MAG: RidA family protein [Euryarchaeota archaeon]|nr:RidA family protein [Euryarchaeota archaeon]